MRCRCALAVFANDFVRGGWRAQEADDALPSAGAFEVTAVTVACPVTVASPQQRSSSSRVRYHLRRPNPQPQPQR